MRKKDSPHIGTSGWMYKDWDSLFYPSYLPNTEKLGYIAQHFSTVEVNVTFYHYPKSSTFIQWYEKTPKDFIFSLKVSRYISHHLRLQASIRPWNMFIKGALLLKEKLGPLLIQFPPSFKADKTTIKRFSYFFK